jgi:hypothetical protein
MRVDWKTVVAAVIPASISVIGSAWVLIKSKTVDAAGLSATDAGAHNAAGRSPRLYRYWSNYVARVDVW